MLYSDIRKKKIVRFAAAYVAVSMLAQIASPTIALALTSGPSQPEIQSFEPAGTSDMVDLFSGDFNYNIPLFDLPGPNGSYPFNIAYHSGIGMDQEASWVGLGWNINPGAINRDKRGLPDDFKGEAIETQLDMAPNITYGASASRNIELWGGDAGLNLGLTIYKNSFKGVGYSLDPGFGMASENASLGLGLSFDSQEGIGANADVSYGHNLDGKTNDRTYGGGIGVGFNSQRGLSLSAFGFATRKNNVTNKGGHKLDASGGGSTYSFAERSFMPAFTNPMTGINTQITIKAGGSAAGIFENIPVSGFYREESVLNNGKKSYTGYGYNYLENEGATNTLMDFSREKDGLIRKESPNLPTPILTFDTYTALGQGFLGSYRAHRNDIGHLHDPYVESEIVGGSFGVDLGFGVPFHLGLAASKNATTISSGDWTENNDVVTSASTNYSYSDGSFVDDHDYENVYYKMKGETTSFETTELDYIAGELAARPDLDKRGSFLDRNYVPADGKLVPSSGTAVTSLLNARDDGRERIKRDNSIQPVTNELLLDGATNPVELLGEYKIKYYNGTSSISGNPYPTSTYSRTGWTKYQTAGFSCVNPSGQRYVYALPAYNKTEEEIAFTIDAGSYTSPALSENTNFLASIPDLGANQDGYKIAKTDRFKSSVSTAAYAHAYLLTSVLGADYVDLTGDGPTDDDYGYWVKFNYVKVADDYKWRSPFTGALYSRGKNNAASDDKAMFNFGTKEIWNLASAETKTHIAVFKLSPRKDGGEANGRYSTGIGSNSLYKLDEINLYSKVDYENTSGTPLPLKTVHFDYTYDLCGSVPNNNGAAVGSDYFAGVDRNANHGKLTLKKLWFTYQNNARGELSPYVFDYHERTGGNINTSENPNFGYDNYDRWGGYKASSDFFRSKNLPYASQFNPANTQTSSEKTGFKNNTDQFAAVWNLKEITLPTGGSIKVDYEADDYANVQHRQATQMFQILKLGNLRENVSDPSNTSDVNDPSKVYGTATGNSEWGHTYATLRRVYFKLETPISSGIPGAARQKFFNDYLAGLRQADGTLQMYFSINPELRDGIHETVGGYCNLLETNSSDYGLTDIDNNNNYTTGFVTLKLLDGANAAVANKGEITYHPFAVAAWQYMRTTQPELLTALGSLDKTPGTSAMDKAIKVKNLLSVIPAVAQTFAGYRKYAFNHNWGNHLDLNRSFIRLGTPDKVKFGGGLRVKRIRYNDNWSSSSPEESSNTYGQVYQYTITENGQTYSSGVAQYEPLIGGDENALRHAKTYSQTIPLFTDNNLFYEYPINESYFPGASVGYSKVTVQSFASYRTTANSVDMDPNDPDDNALDVHIPSTGIVEYEFYTAKDFPVITDETDNQSRKFDLFIPIPFIGQITSNKLFATQGYSITLNDMHGKLKAITNYAKNTNGERNPVPVSSVNYEYKFQYKNYDGQTVKVLDNTVTAIVNESVDGNTANSTFNAVVCNKKNVIMGEEYDFFTDSRQSTVLSSQWGLSLNMEFAGLFPPIPCPWPAIATSTKKLRTFVTNKVIQKSGILTKTVATDGISVVTTENKLFDAQTGTPLLTTVTNDFDKPVYTYNHPAHWEYDGMGSAAKNFNYMFYTNKTSPDPDKNTFQIELNNVSRNVDLNIPQYKISPDAFYNTIAEGDEFIIQDVSSGLKYLATLITKQTTYNSSCNPANNLVFYSSATALLGTELKFNLIRSGRRNNLSSDVGSVTALKDPTDNDNRFLRSIAPGTIDNVALLSEFYSLLHGLIYLDPLTQKHLLPFTTINFGDNSMYNSNGSPAFPLLSKIVIGSIKISHNISTRNYQVNFAYKKYDGTCGTFVYNAAIYIESGQILDIKTFDLNLISGGISSTYYNSPTGFGSTNPIPYFPGTPVNNNYYTYIDDVITSSSVLFNNFWDFNNPAPSGATAGRGDGGNVYAQGKKGIWKPALNYYYKDERVDQPLTASVDLKHDGVYKGTGAITNKNEFYLFNWKPTTDRPVPVQWMPNSVVAMYDQNSNAVETRDIVNIPSSVQYGYNGNLPVIQAKNAVRQEIYYQSFDDPSALGNFTSISGVSHTAKKSYAVTGNPVVALGSGLQLAANKKYTISLWVSQNKQVATYANTSDNVGIKLKFYDASNTEIVSGLPPAPTLLITPSGNVIETWQRIEGDFTVPPGTKSVGIHFQTNADGTGTDITNYFDDIRIFPTKSNVSTSVYDPNNFRISAVLDANNFATIYNYDEEGKLFMIKKETIDGIKTIKEERSHIKQ